MGQPTPPGDLPLIEGLDASWNEFVSAIPEDRRAELAPKLKEQLAQYEPLKQWEDLHKSGITPDQAGTALNLFSIIENNPQEVYETIGKHLGITKEEAKEVVKEIEKDDSGDPRILQMQQQLDTLAQIALAQREMTTKEKQAEEQDRALEKEINDIKAKYGDDIPEDEILMRMGYKGMTAEQAYQEYTGRVTDIRSRRPAPRIMGSGGVIPSNAINPIKLSNQDTKSLVAQMIEHGNQERRN
jgi:polyhydroxyalkanoate synthesis regulator phasin